MPEISVHASRPVVFARHNAASGRWVSSAALRQRNQDHGHGCDRELKAENCRNPGHQRRYEEDRQGERKKPRWQTIPTNPPSGSPAG